MRHLHVLGLLLVAILALTIATRGQSSGQVSEVPSPLNGELGPASNGPALGPSALPWSLTKLTLRADLIVRGRITGQISNWDDDRTVIYTTSILAVTDQIKGSRDSKLLKIKAPGGVVGDIGLVVSPAPRLVPGEDVLVFLEPSPAGGYQVTGAVQGAYAIRRGWAVNDEMGTTEPLTPFVQRVLEIMDAHNIVSPLPPDWESRFPPAAPNPPDFLRPLDYVYEGYHWPGPDPMGEPYLVNVNTADVPADEALQAIQAAADTWTDVSGADFEFIYGGSTTATDISGHNDKNEILWKDEGDTGTLGTNRVLVLVKHPGDFRSRHGNQRLLPVGYQRLAES